MTAGLVLGKKNNKKMCMCNLYTVDLTEGLRWEGADCIWDIVACLWRWVVKKHGTKMSHKRSNQTDTFWL